MKYFIDSSKRKKSQSTEYHGFRQRKWDWKTHWKEDSIYLHDDLFTNGFAKAIRSVVPDYNYYGPTEISKNEWDMIGKAVENEADETKKLYQEATLWLDMIFQKYDCFTILGI